MSKKGDKINKIQKLRHFVLLESSKINTSSGTLPKKHGNHESISTVQPPL